MPTLLPPPLLAIASLSDRDLLVGGFLVIAILYLAVDTLRGRPHRDRKGRFRSKRRGRFVGLLKIAVVVAVLWVAASVAGYL